MSRWTARRALTRATIAAATALTSTVVVLPALPAQAAATLPAGVEVKNLSSNDAPSGHPEIAAAGDHVYEVWTDFGYDPREIGTVVLKVSNDGGLTYPIKRLVSQDLPYSEEPDVAAAGDSAYVVWQSTTSEDDPGAGRREIYFQAIHGGGTKPAQRPMDLSLDEQDSVDPRVVVAPGWVLVTWTGLGGDVHLAYSDDDGSSFTKLLVADGARGGEVAVADGTAYVVTTPADNSAIDVTPIPLHREKAGAPLVPGPTTHVVTGPRLGNPQVAAWGATSHVVWEDASGVRPAMFYARSTNRAETWSAPRRISPADGFGGLGDLSVDQRGVWVASTWLNRGTVVQHSGDLGQTWDQPLTLAGTNTWGEARFSELPGAAQTQPQAAVDWRMPDRYGLDRNHDGLVDYYTSADYLRPSAFRVVLDGCASTGGDSPITHWRWTVDGSTTEATSCRTTREFPHEGVFPVTLEVQTADGETAKTVHDVDVEDRLVISIGDSVASGEGVPDKPGTGVRGTDAVWQDKRCHRSAVAGPSQAAMRLEASDPRSSVTFLHLACSGASVLEDIYEGLQISGGGLLTPYEGIVDPGGAPLPPQLTEAKELTTGREVDALLVSIGANDQKFSKVVEGCIAEDCGPGTQIETDFLARNARLQNHYNALANQLGTWVDPARVFLTEYFDPTHDQTGGVNLRCVVGSVTERVTDAETTWAYDNVMRRLNEGVQQGVQAHGWTYVGGISDTFSPHGYCAQDGWVQQIGQSITDQGDHNGGFHPNRVGHQLYGKQIAAALTKAMPPVSVPESHEPQREDTGGDIHLAREDAGTVTITPLTSKGAGITAKPAIAMPRSTPHSHQDVHLVSTGTDVIATYVDNQNPDLNGNMRWWEVMAARVPTAAENLRLRKAELVQGPDGASFVVAGKATAVRAEIVSTLKTTRYVRIALHADRTTTGPVDSASLVALHPGVNVVHLHAEHDLLPSPDSDRFAVRVEVDNDGTVDEAIESDNRLTTPSLPVETTRPLRLLFVPLQQSGEQPTACAAVEQVVTKARPWLQSALPVADGQLGAEASCAAAVQVGTGDLAHTLGILDALGSSTGYDAVVGVARSGWFADRAGALSGAVGAALGGASGAPRRGVVVESGFGGPLVAHEVGHLFGAEHATRPASGYAVAQREVHDDLDVMHPATTDARWVGAETFRMLGTQLGSTDAAAGPARSLADGAPESLLVDGVLKADGTFEAGAWSRVDLAPTAALGADGPLVLRYVGDGGDVLGTVGLTSSAGEGAGSSATTADSSVVARVPVVDGTRRYVLVRGDDVLLDRAVSATAPTVQVTTPAEGATVSPGGSLDVTWTASDGDGDSLSYDVALSSDGGVSWVPAARGLSAPSARLTVDRGLAGTAVLVRVTASDGARSTSAVSASVPVKAALGPGKFALEVDRDVKLPDRDWPVRWTTVWTVNPDGSGLTHITEDLKSVLHPAWSPDGKTLAVEVPNSIGAGQIMLMDPDGTNRRIVNGLATDYNIGSCPTWSPDGKALAYTYAGIWIINADGTGNHQIADQTLGSDANGNGYVWRFDCPDWSPDGRTIAFMGQRSDFDGDRFMTINTDGSGFRDITAQATAGYNGDALAYDQNRVNFSPEGELVFKRRDGIFAIQPDGTGLRKLFQPPYNVGWDEMAWSPDGSQLYGTTTLNAPGSYDLGVVNPNGTGGRNVTKFPYDSLKRWAGYADWGVVRDTGETPPPAEHKLADAGGPYTVAEGATVLLDATRGDRPGGEVPAYAWDLDGDGQYDDAEGATVPFTPAQDGDHTVGLRVTTSTGTTASDSAEVHVTNAEPTASLRTDRAVAGEPFTLPVSVADPGTEDALSVDVYWGDGSTSTGLEVAEGRVRGAQHAYAAAGDHQVTATVCDDRGACGSASATVSVLASAPPRVHALLPDHGDKRGGTEVVVTGELLSGATAVRFGDVPATAVRVLSDRQLVATAPALPGGAPVAVTVQSPGGTSAATPTARFTPDNAVPAVADAAVSTAVGSAVQVQPAASDPDGDQLTLSVTTQPEHGSVDGPDDQGRFTYTPAAGWSGTDTFVVQVDDGVDTARATVRIRVGSRAPVPGNDAVSLPAAGGSVAASELLANDADPEGDALTVIGVGEPAGAVTGAVLSNGTVTITAGAGAEGSFRYTVRDATGMESTATVFVAVAAGNGSPVVADEASPANGNEGTTLTTSGRFTDPDGDPLTLTVDGPGTLAAAPDGTFTWSLPTEDDTSGTVTVTAADGKGGTASQTFAYAATNVAPTIGTPALSGGSCGSPVRLVAAVTDAGPGDAITTVVAWGDGTTATTGRAVDLQHTYATAGTWTVTVTATDDDGGRTVSTVTVSTEGGSKPGALQVPLDRNGRPVFTLGSTLPVKLAVTDCSGAVVKTLAPRLSMALVSGGTERPVSIVGGSSADKGDVLRYSDGKYVFTLSLKASRFTDGGALVAGTYRLRVWDPSFAGPVEATVVLQK